MTLDARTLAAGDGWRVQEVICNAGPRDRAFEEQHGSVSIAAVMGGTFQYRTAQGSALLAPGALLLGNHGRCFECGHEHGVGDRCLSFHFTPAYWENLVAAVPGARKATFANAHVPPGRPLARLLASLESARESDAPSLEETANTLAAIALHADAGMHSQPRPPSRQDVQRVSEAVRRIETQAHQADRTLSLGELAREAGLSPWHFLRIFRHLVGMTPHQYILHTRMHHAAVRLRQSSDLISDIAFKAGFNDLSTFNHRFRTVIGTNPSAYRTAK